MVIVVMVLVESVAVALRGNISETRILACCGVDEIVGLTFRGEYMEKFLFIIILRVTRFPMSNFFMGIGFSNGIEISVIFLEVLEIL